MATWAGLGDEAKVALDGEGVGCLGVRIEGVTWGIDVGLQGGRSGEKIQVCKEKEYGRRMSVVWRGSPRRGTGTLGRGF